MQPILVVDDEAIVRESIRDWLKDSGYKVRVAESGEEALKMIEEDNYGVMILDLRLPNMNGIDVLKKVKQSKPNMKSIVITAYPTMQTQEEVSGLGAIDYLVKPVFPAKLEAIVKEALGKGENSNSMLMFGYKSSDIFMFDELDLQIIQALQENSRASYVDLAKSLGVVRDTVKKRIQEMQKSGLLKISTKPNLQALGYNFMSMVGMQINISELTRISEALAKKPNVCYLACVTGRYDLVAIIISRSAEELKRIIESDISSVQGILRTETFVSLDIVKGGLLEFDTTDIINRLFSELKTLSANKKK